MVPNTWSATRWKYVRETLDYISQILHLQGPSAFLCGDCSSAGRALGCGPGCRGFEPRQSPHFPFRINSLGFIFMAEFPDHQHILSVSQMAQAGHLALPLAGLDGFALMQAAGLAVAEEAKRLLGRRTFLVLCGPGNNGGDGYIAAMNLRAEGMDVRLYALAPPAQMTGDAARAVTGWTGPVRNFSELLNNLEHGDFDPDRTGVIDAVFGAGLSRALDFPVKDAFAKIRALDLPVIAVDVPSGVNGDTGAVDESAPKCLGTVTFFRKKPAHVLMPGMDQCGLVSVADIGIPDEAIEKTGFAAMENCPPLWVDDVPVTHRGQHKYDRGHVLVLGGGRLTGAARLAGAASMRIGAGVCTIAAPAEVQRIYQTGPAHIMSAVADTPAAFLELAGDARRNALLIGPGAGLDRADDLRAIVLGACGLAGRSVVLDADAISAFAGYADELFHVAHDHCILTPHEGEFARLFGDLPGSKIDRVKEAAKRSGAVILLKGADTVIAGPDGTCVVSTHGPSWLATAGAGDVLAGMIAGLVAQGVPPFTAACMAAWMHGETAWRLGPGLVAADLAEGIPGILRDWA